MRKRLITLCIIGLSIVVTGCVNGTASVDSITALHFEQPTILQMYRFHDGASLDLAGYVAYQEAGSEKIHYQKITDPLLVPTFMSQAGAMYYFASNGYSGTNDFLVYDGLDKKFSTKTAPLETSESIEKVFAGHGRTYATTMAKATQMNRTYDLESGTYYQGTAGEHIQHGFVFAETTMLIARNDANDTQIIQIFTPEWDLVNEFTLKLFPSIYSVMLNNQAVLVSNLGDAAITMIDEIGVVTTYQPSELIGTRYFKALFDNGNGTLVATFDEVSTTDTQLASAQVIFDHENKTYQLKNVVNDEKIINVNADYTQVFTTSVTGNKREIIVRNSSTFASEKRVQLKNKDYIFFVTN